MDVEDYFDIIRRHKAWILGPTFAALVIVNRRCMPLAQHLRLDRR